MTSKARYILTLIALTASLCSSAAGKTRFFNHCVDLPSETLMDMGHHYVHEVEMPDSALVCYTVVTGRYAKNITDRDKQTCIDAYIGEWYIYFFIFFNYSKALECLYLAENVCQEAGLTRPDIYMDLGCTYQTIAEESRDNKLYRQALDHYKRAVREAFDTGDTETLNITFTNIITTAYALDDLVGITVEWNRYKDMDMPESQQLLAGYNRLLYLGLDYTATGRYEKAVETFDRQITLTEGRGQLKRYLIISHLNKADAYVKAGDYAKAIGCLQPAMQIAATHDIKDARLDIYRTLADCYRQLGMMAESIEYREKYFNIKDTLLNYHQLASINETRFMNEMKKMDDRLTQMRHRHQIFNIVAVIFAVVLVIVICFVYILYIKNRQLKKSNKLLYKKNIEILQSEEKERALRKKYEPVQAAGEAETDGDNAAESGDKPRKKSPGVENMDDIYSRIRSVMENSETIFSPDFSAESLSALVGVKQRYVSQTLHEKGGTSFYAMLGEYRVKEACKRFRDDENYRNLTIEGIAYSVGFKSRSNFINTFKRIVGLTPSEYQKMVKDGI